MLLQKGELKMRKKVQQQMCSGNDFRGENIVIFNTELIFSYEIAVNFQTGS